jgi:phosphatidate cytidylyltransferase
MLSQRVLTSLWFVPLLVVVVWFGGQAGFTTLVATFGALAALEFYRMVTATRVSPITYFGITWTVFFILSRNPDLLALLDGYFDANLLSPILISSAVIISLIVILAYRNKGEAFTRWVWTIAGMFYVGWLLSYLVALRGLEGGRNWVFLLLFVTWVSDTTAFFVGRRFGRHKLAPSISPGKTWEGTIGGVCGAIAMSTLFFTANPFQLPLAYWQAIPLSVGVSVMGQVGDLVESLLKRGMGVKDSGTLMPGHGGILDRLDSLIFAGVLVYYFALWVT